MISVRKRNERRAGNDFHAEMSRTPSRKRFPSGNAASAEQEMISKRKRRKRRAGNDFDAETPRAPSRKRFPSGNATNAEQEMISERKREKSINKPLKNNSYGKNP